MQIKKSMTILITIMMIVININPAFALDDGAYLIGRSTSYVNPLTGNTEDGGTNVTLGDSMVASIVEGNLLLEQTGGKYYLTIGLGLASNVSNIRFKIMNSSGSFSDISATKTGSSSANGDTVNHYRMQISSLDVYISPIMYVNPMGRDVQFFIKLNQGEISAGTGVYSSTMVPETTSKENTSAASTAASSNNSTTPKNETSNETVSENTSETTVAGVAVGEVSRESLFEGVSGLSSYVIDNGKVNKKKQLTAKNLLSQNKSVESKFNYSLLIIGFIIVIMVIGGVFYYVKKIKK